MNMICPICKGTAEEQAASRVERLIICKGCGEYRMSATFSDLVGGRSFDVDLTRAVLQQRREQGLDLEVEPLLVSTDENLLIELCDTQTSITFR
jgi:hypothetical protein